MRQSEGWARNFSKSEIRNSGPARRVGSPKDQYRNPKQIRIFKILMPKQRMSQVGQFRFEHLSIRI
jgi:hypothetical protein